MAVNGVRIRLHLQEGLGGIAALMLAPCYFLFLRCLRYRIRGLREIRQSCRRHLQECRGPWLICANHLTMIDSMILIHALFSLPGHLYGYRRIPWNLPERDNFSNPLVAVLCYLAKCIPIHRGGSRKGIRGTLEKCSYLLKRRQNLMIFPEGGRSRTGRIDRESFAYGVGRFIQDCEPCRVMCLYLRGDGQQTYSSIPKRGETFTLEMEVFKPEPSLCTGLRAQRDYATQVIERLAAMEDRYFESHRKRHCGSDRSPEHRKEPRQPLSQARLYPS